MSDSHDTHELAHELFKRLRNIKLYYKLFEFEKYLLEVHLDLGEAVNWQFWHHRQAKSNFIGARDIDMNQKINPARRAGRAAAGRAPPPPCSAGRLTAGRMNQVQAL